MISSYVAIGAGGAIGAMMRHGVNMSVVRLVGGTFPFGIMAVNILGCFAMGILVGIFAHIWSPPSDIKSFLTTGILGGFTTFSAFSLDAVTLWERGDTLAAMMYVCFSVMLSIAGLGLGMSLVRGIAG
jgi:CrcB protein